MKILVTGASGFLGKNFIERSRHRNLYAASTSNFNTLKVKEWLFGDLCDWEFINKLAKERFDVIIHFAWIGLPNREKQMNQRNFEMYSKILSAFSNFESVRHIFIGSCLEYGNLLGKVSTVSEGIQVDDFGLVKTSICKQVHQLGLTGDWLRLFYVYGPYQQKQSLFNTVYEALKKGENVSLKTPFSSHDFIHVFDIVNAIDELLDIESKNQIYNLGSGTLTSNAEFANFLMRKFKVPEFEINHQAHGMYANFAETKSKLNWTPRLSVPEGIEATLSFIEG